MSRMTRRASWVIGTSARFSLMAMSQTPFPQGLTAGSFSSWVPGQHTPPAPAPARCPVPLGQAKGREGRQRISTLWVCWQQEDDYSDACPGPCGGSRPRSPRNRAKAALPRNLSAFRSRSRTRGESIVPWFLRAASRCASPHGRSRGAVRHICWGTRGPGDDCAQWWGALSNNLRATLVTAMHGACAIVAAVASGVLKTCAIDPCAVFLWSAVSIVSAVGSVRETKPAPGLCVVTRESAEWPPWGRRWPGAPPLSAVQPPRAAPRARSARATSGAR